MTNQNLIDDAAIGRIRQLEAKCGRPLLPELVVLFSKQCPDDLEKIRALMEKKDYKKLILTAHDLKSTAANLGAIRLQVLAENIEHNAEKWSEFQLKTQVALLDKEFELAANELKKYL